MKPAVSAVRHWAWVWLLLGTSLSSSAANVTVSGQLVGRLSNKPLAKAWVCLGTITQDKEGMADKILLTEFSAVTDDNGQFTLKDVPAGEYTLVYRPAPGGPPKGLKQVPVRDLSRFTRSIMPMLRNVEIGVREPFADRSWGGLTLLKGHTLYCVSLGGPYMKVWNATARSGAQGPCVEMRKNKLWMQNFQGNTQLKLQAWSY